MLIINAAKYPVDAPQRRPAMPRARPGIQFGSALHARLQLIGHLVQNGARTSPWHSPPYRLLGKVVSPKTVYANQAVDAHAHIRRFGRNLQSGNNVIHRRQRNRLTIGMKQRVVFNMSRTLSIGNEGPRAVNLALGPIYLGRNSR